MLHSNMFLVYIADAFCINGYFLSFLIKLGLDRKFSDRFFFHLIVSLILNSIKLHIINLNKSGRI